MSFVHLHVHSCYSLLDGAIRVEELAETAKKMEMPAVALTDHGQMFGLLSFYKAARKAGVKPILGVETYVAARGRQSREQGERRNHLTLLAQNEAGYRNLCRLISRANIEGFYHRPRVDLELLERYNEGVIALSGCLQGEVPYFWLRGEEDEARAAAGRYAEIFKDRFYLEIQENALQEQTLANQGLMKIAEKLSLPLVATNDCHYLLKEHHDAHDILLCIQTGKKRSEENRMRFSTREFYFKSPEEMRKAFEYCPEAVANTLAIAARCDGDYCRKIFPDELKPENYAFPAIKLDAGENADERLARLAREGLDERIKAIEKSRPFSDEERAAYRERLEEEIALINHMKFPGYFLIVADFIGWAKKRGIPVGPGRGSAAGSLVAWAMLITDIDPIRFGLLFERFLNPERISMPDIDVDFCTDGREDVIKYVTEAYGGKEQVSQIITFGQMKAKAVIRDVGRTLDLELKEVDRIAKLVPNTLNISLTQAMKDEPEIKKIADADPRVAELIKFALVLENLPRHASTHAAGVVIGDKPLMEHLPLYCDSATETVDGEKTQVITQFDMKGVEGVGLIKFDFLGLKTLTLIKHCLALLKERGEEVNLDEVGFDDAKTYQLLANGDTTGVFQLESSGMREILMRLKASCIDDLMGMVALYRPGPLGSGMVDQFVDGKHGRGKADYYGLPQLLKPLLEETYGVILYQEQVMRVSQVLANYSLGEADLLRRAMGKKKPEEMAKQEARFMQGAAENKIDTKKAKGVFDAMAKFAEYGFNKSHSAAYAVVAYHTAYLKANYPVEFMAALMSSEQGNQDKIVRLIGESRAAGIDVRPPDVNASGYKFSVAGQAIAFGLGAVKGVGEAAIEVILEARKDGPFTDLFDFCERVETQKVNRRVIETLINCGAFDASGGVDRAVMSAALDDAMEAGARAMRDRRSGQSNMFDIFAEAAPEAASVQWPNVPPWPENKRLACEKEALGFFITGHPLAKHEMELKVLSNCRGADIADKPDQAEVRLGGVLAKVQKKVSKPKGDKPGKPFAILTLEDLTGSVEIMVWNDLYEETKDLLTPEQVLLVVGKVESGEFAGKASVKIIAKELMPLSEALEKRCRSIIFRVQRKKIDPAFFTFMENVFEKHKGGAAAFLRIVDNGGEAIYKMKAALSASRALIEHSHQTLGPQSLELR